MVLRINLNKQLRELFFKWLERLECERTHRVVSHRPPSYTPHQERINFGDDNEIIGCIYFYEWSNATAIPRTFYTLKAFENFLDRSGIYVPSYQWELIRNIANPYIACKEDCKELLIKVSWDALKEALEEEKKPSAPIDFSSSHKGSEDKEPYNVGITRVPMANQEPKILNCKIHSSAIQKPPMYAEVDNRYPDMEQIGDWWG
jgi:hypothetical protein